MTATENAISLETSGIDAKYNKWLNYSILVLAFVIPVSRSGISIMIFAIPFLWILEGGWQHKWKILKHDRLIQAITIYVTFICLSLLWTKNFTTALANAKNYGHLILIPVMLTSLRYNFRFKIIFAYALGMMSLVILSILNYAGVIKITYYIIYTSIGTTLDHVHTANVFMHTLDYSMFLAWAVIFGIYFLYNAFKENNIEILRKKYMYLWAALIILCLFWIFIQRGRSGQFAMIFTMIFLFYFMLKNQKKKYFYAIGVLVFLIFMQYRWNPEFKNRVDHVVSDVDSYSHNIYSSSLGNRILAHEIAWEMIKKSWLFGHGIGDNMDIFKQHVEDLQKKMAEEKMPSLRTIYEVSENHMHSQYLQVLTETGIIGLIMFFSIFWIFIFKGPNRKISFLITIFFYTGFLGEPFLRNQFTSVLICFFMGYIYSEKNMTSAESN